MSEEINLDASNISINEDAFEKFQPSSMLESEDEFITLADIVPPQPSVSDHELNEIPYDNEVVLGSPRNGRQGQVSSHYDTGSQLLDISENNVNSSEEGFNDNTSHVQNSEEIMNYQDLSSDGLGAQNYVIEDNATIIQDSLLSTTADQSDAQLGTPSEVSIQSPYPRRTKRGRIPNTMKYPMPSASDSDPNKINQPKRRGRPKKNPVVQLITEPDSTNIDNTNISSANGVLPDESKLEESTPNNYLKKGRRGRPRKTEEITPTPSRRGRTSTKSLPQPLSEKLDDAQVNEITLVESTNTEEVEMDIDTPLQNSFLDDLTLSKPKGKKRGRKKGKKASVESTSTIKNVDGHDDDDADDADDICLSQLKQDLVEVETTSNSDVKISINNLKGVKGALSGEVVNEKMVIGTEPKMSTGLVDDVELKAIDDNQVNKSNENIDSPSKRNCKMPVMSDFEYNIDKAVREATDDVEFNKTEDNEECLLVEDTSKRRRTSKKIFVYDEGSDEDPFANLESSDDEPKRKKKGTKYYSDDEYIPDGDNSRKRGGCKIRSSSSEDDDLKNDELLNTKKRKTGLSPFKKGRKALDSKSIVSTIPPKNEDDDIEVCLETTMIKTDESMKPPAEAWATSNAFQDFIAQKIQSTNLQIKKVSTKEKADAIIPLDIPVLNQNEPKKTAENSTQTKASTSSLGVQTSAPYDIPMKTKINLSAAQSEKACEFLKSVVKTTAELGNLMSQKSDDFMRKKINTEHVTDTIKMDYCVRKSFLLFKLAKHNLLQMEDDLAKQYEKFLNEHNLSQCREVPKKITPKVKDDSDSDCEIVEVVGATGPAKKEKGTSKFNPKTVFLNKELSIKIAKKPSAPEKPPPGKNKLDIKGRHAVWINKNVMVKKINPSQSFLAQDSRNKKPPDTYVTEKMVSEFFKSYDRNKALVTCAPFINTDWTCVRREYACNYFVNELEAANSSIHNNDVATESFHETPDENCNYSEVNDSPKSLITLCTEVICKCLKLSELELKLETQKLTCNVTDGTDTKEPVALLRLCIDALRTNEIRKSDNHKKQEIVNSYDMADLDKVNNTDYIFQNSNDWSDQNGVQDDSNGVENFQNEDENVSFEHKIQLTSKCPIQASVSSLTKICYEKIVKMFYKAETKRVEAVTNVSEVQSIKRFGSMYQENGLFSNPECAEEYQIYSTILAKNGVKSLLALCLDLIQSLQGLPKEVVAETNVTNTRHSNTYELNTLKKIALQNINHILNQNNVEDMLAAEIPAVEIQRLIESEEINQINENFTINFVNTVSEEAFENLQLPLTIRIRKQSQHSNYSNDYDNNSGDHNEINFNVVHEEVDNHENTDFNALHEADDNGWASQLQMQEFRSCYTPHANAADIMEEQNNDALEEPREVMSHIKSEPVEYAEESVIDTSIVKSEPVQPLQALDEMTHIPDNIMTKRELMEAANDGSVHIQDSYNVESFEQFVSKNKLIQSMDESDGDIFSQSGLRIRRQHEPDLDAESDMNLGLLVPHTFEPLHLVEAKGSLMQSSSDEDSNSKKNIGKKKDKRKKKSKKDAKIATTKETLSINKEVSVKEKDKPVDEVTMLTRRMRDKIRKEEKKVQSSDSEYENLILNSKKDKNKKDKFDQEKSNNQSGSDSDTLYMLSALNDTGKGKEIDKINVDVKLKDKKNTKNKHAKEIDDVQCNNVDSTEKNVYESKNLKANNEATSFSGFTAIDQNEITNYHKLMQFVYDKIIPSNDNENIVAPQDNNDTGGPLINPEDPVEFLECEPAMPMFDDEPRQRPGPKKFRNKKKNTIVQKDKTPFTDRHGWHCYPIDCKETKLYKSAQILLEKLPESFVDTYMEYQDVMDKDLDDAEVDRLINLQTLNRSINIKDIKDSKSKIRPKIPGNDMLTNAQNSENFSRSPSPTYSDNFDELVPSDDEGPRLEDERPPLMPVKSSENNMAKNLLMDDHDSDSDSGIKKINDEPKEPNEREVKSKKAGPKSKEMMDPESLMLTADKMMNKELNLLHAPVMMSGDVKCTATKDNSPKDESKSIKKMSTRQSKERIKNEDDSSSEEEKQWVNTKEKLLKRLGKKEDTIADDAKRVKLVNEFIERRNEAERRLKSEKPHGRNRRNRRKRLEALRQLRFLSNELNSDGDGVQMGKRGAAAGLFKGRRNIRKVIDKKSLTRSTVVANMEEFERKRRLNMRQNKLRDVLGCEEGVNVLVINDEVCLEYDFEQNRPVVAVHQFFTKVMKAHQYEGVKFMWDACFESLATIESGHPGGGCILAHCMGLGKTLQVLALLHTVLTHPRANMQRVLVCCPLSTVLNWVDEIHKWIGPVTHEIKVFELSKLKKTYERAYQLDDWFNGGGIFIIGYELFRSLTTLDPEIDEVRPTIINKIRSALLDPGPDIIVCDEGHLLKNDCSVLAVAMSRVTTKRRIVLTGTPMQNNLREYFCMVNFIKPNLLGTYSEYSNRFENPIMNGQHRDSVQEDIKLMKARTHILHKVLEGCLQRQEASVLYPYLPKKHEYTVFIPLTQCQWDLYHHYMDNFTKTDKKQILKDFHVLQKIWSHPQVLHNFLVKDRDKKDKIKAEKLEDDLALADQEADIKPPVTEVWWLEYLNEGTMLDTLETSNKFVAVFRILDECVSLGDKVLIFSTSLFCLDAMEYFLKKMNKWSLGQEYYRLDGSVPAEVRQKWCREFNAENNHNTKLFLISTRAGCLGLNMTAANRVILMDTSWNPAHDIQSIFRVYRFGQKKDCFIYRLVALGTMEQKIYERSVTKQAVACRVVDEQQIDRHYNLAELTELYSVDELGLSVAGGVAVGVNDIALLRVARDAPIHAVHEHDSLLRGSSEQGLPEHERAAAWTQFQLEHEHKQMQNDLSATKKGKIALKRLKMENLNQQALYSAANALPNVAIKTEPSILPHTPTFDTLVVPKEEPGPKLRGRKAKLTSVVQCRIPIAPGPHPGTSSPTEEEDQLDMVRKITNLLIKHNFMQNNAGPKQIADLVSKVKQMVATRQPLALGPGYDELSTSIANVLLHREEPPQTEPIQNEPPPITPTVENKRGLPRKVNEDAPESPPITPFVEKKRGQSRKGNHDPPEIPPITPVVEKKRGQPRKGNHDVPEIPPITPVVEKKRGQPRKGYHDAPEKPPTPPPPSPPLEEGRRRRKAAIAAAKLFDAHADVIDLDDDDWQNDDDAEIVDDDPVESSKPEKPKGRKAKPPKSKPEQTAPVPSQAIDSSIVLSDDETGPVNPVVAPDTEVIALHPSLLTNQNFIKIVAHTYLSGNPMMDEDAATLAAQYSTLKTLKEAESEGKLIESGAVYDIAVQVLGKDVLRKLQAANPQTPGETSAAAKKLQTILGGKVEPEPPPPAAAVKKPKIGPKSQVAKKVKQEPNEIAKPKLGAIKTSLLIAPPPAPAPRVESILPDEEVLISEPEHLDKKNTALQRVKLEKRIARLTSPATPVALGRGPAPTQATPLIQAPSPSDTTICLDSDEETPPAAIAPPSRRKQNLNRLSAPIPVALTGPGLNARPVPLPPPPPRLNVPRPMFYKLSPCGTHAIPVTGATPVPISMVGPNGAPQPLPKSLLAFGQGSRDNPIPVSFSGPSGSQYSSHAPGTHSGSMQSQPVPISLTGPGAQPVPISLTGPNSQPIPIPGIVHQTYTPMSVPQPVSLVDSNGCAVAFPGTSNVQPYTLRIDPGQPRAIVPRPQPAPVTNAPNKTVCKPGDVFRISKGGYVEILHRKPGKTPEPVTHTIPDDEPEPVPEPPPPPKPAEVKKPAKANQPATKPAEVNIKKPLPRKRMMSRSLSSSSSSARSRSSSPADPLAILKDVVHIQAPVKESKQKLKETPKPAAKTKPQWVVDAPDPKHKTAKTTQIEVASVDLTKLLYNAPNKSGPKKSAGSVDLTLQTRQRSKDSGGSKAGTLKLDSSSSKKIITLSKLVGTTKNIILDGKTKSLKVEGKSSAMSVVVTSSKPTAGKQKPVEKRPAPPTIVSQAKKKKSEPMTLKDFDIDDIDDIIELD